jgi:hypothetical protein
MKISNIIQHNDIQQHRPPDVFRDAFSVSKLAIFSNIAHLVGCVFFRAQAWVVSIFKKDGVRISATLGPRSR